MFSINYKDYIKGNVCVYVYVLAKLICIDCGRDVRYLTIPFVIIRVNYVSTQITV